VTMRVPTLYMSIALALSDLLAQNAGSKRQQLTATPELIGQKYCSGDNEIFSVILDLRVKFVNHGDTPLILDRKIGVWYQLAVAKNKEDLSAKKFESNPNIDWTGSVLAMSTGSPERLLQSDFVVIAPEGSFDAEIKPSVFALYQNTKDFKDVIAPGRHVIEVYLPAWNHTGNPSHFQNLWRQCGELGDGMITTSPIEFEVPRNPKIDVDCSK